MPVKIYCSEELWLETHLTMIKKCKKFSQHKLDCKLDESK